MSLENYSIRNHPKGKVLEGQYVSLIPFDIDKHAEELFTLFTAHDAKGETWRFLPYGYFTRLDEYLSFCKETYLSDDPYFYAIIPNTTGKASGVMALMSIDRSNGVIETGHLYFTPILQKTRESTEAFYVLASYVFEELGYRRFEWKCNNANTASKRAAKRFGFTFEGIFRQHGIVKGKNRDTAWFSMLDHEWPQIKPRFENWLSPQNFDENGVQKTRL